jgi:hypothetical protein
LQSDRCCVVVAQRAWAIKGCAAEAKRTFYPALVKAAARILFVPILLARAIGQWVDDSRTTAINNLMACRNEPEAAIGHT